MIYNVLVTQLSGADGMTLLEPMHGATWQLPVVGESFIAPEAGGGNRFFRTSKVQVVTASEDGKTFEIQTRHSTYRVQVESTQAQTEDDCVACQLGRSCAEHNPSRPCGCTAGENCCDCRGAA